MGVQKLDIELKDVAKKFGAHFIFSNVNMQLTAGSKYAVTGPNGSGKSTLLKVIAGILTPNQGAVEYRLNGQAEPVENIFTQVAYCAPYQELPEELTLAELLSFHRNLRGLTITDEAFIDAMQIDKDKEIRNYSSGMKQRVKLGLAFYTPAALLLLDEPTSNLDDHWADWYIKLAQNTPAGQIMVVSSNQPDEYSFCSSVFNLGGYTVH